MCFTIDFGTMTTINIIQAICFLSIIALYFYERHKRKRDKHDIISKINSIQSLIVRATQPNIEQHNLDDINPINT